MISLVIPSARYSSLTSTLTFANGKTTIVGLSGVLEKSCKVTLIPIIMTATEKAKSQTAFKGPEYPRGFRTDEVNMTR